MNYQKPVSKKDMAVKAIKGVTEVPLQITSQVHKGLVSRKLQNYLIKNKFKKMNLTKQKSNIISTSNTNQVNNKVHPPTFHRYLMTEELDHKL